MMKGGMAGLMQQAQKMQENMKRAQEELASVEVTGSAGGGMVSVTMNGRHEARRVKIDKALIGGQYLVYAIRAVRDGDVTKATAEERKQLREQLSAVAGGAAQKAHVKAARAKYGITVAEDRL